MSLRHLYIGLNGLGIYPDLIDVPRNGIKFKIMSINTFISVNKYYSCTIDCTDDGCARIIRELRSMNGIPFIWQIRDDHHVCMTLYSTIGNYTVNLNNQRYTISMNQELVHSGPSRFRLDRDNIINMIISIFNHLIGNVNDLNKAVSDVLMRY